MGFWCGGKEVFLWKAALLLLSGLRLVASMGLGYYGCPYVQLQSSPVTIFASIFCQATRLATVAAVSEDLAINVRNLTPVSGDLSGDFSGFFSASLGTVCFAKSLSFALLLDCI